MLLLCDDDEIKSFYKLIKTRLISISLISSSFSLFSNTQISIEFIFLRNKHINRIHSPSKSSLFNHSIESTRSSSSNRYGLEDPSSGYYRSVRLSSRDDENHRFLSGLHRDESLSNIHHSNANNGSNNSSLYGSYIDHRRNAFNRRNTFDLDDNLSSMMSDSDTYVSPLYQHASATRRSSFQNDRLGSSISLFRNRLAKSKSSHAVRKFRFNDIMNFKSNLDSIF